MPSQRTGRVEQHGHRWRFQVFVDGQRIRHSFDTREEAQQALDEVLRGVRREFRQDLAKKLGLLTVADIVLDYLERRRRDLEPSTMSRYDNVVQKHVLPGIGGVDAKEIADIPFLLQEFIDSVPWGSARKALEVLNPAFRAALHNGLISRNPVDAIRRPRRPSRRTKKEIPPPDDVEKIVIAAYEDGFWWGLWVELVATLGLRREEACALRFEDFEFPRPGERYGWIHVRRAVGKCRGGIYVKETKSRVARSLMVHESMFEGLDSFRGRTGWLFPGRPVRPRRNAGDITWDSSAGRLLLWLNHHGGEVSCLSGRAGADARRALGVNSSTLSQVTAALVRQGLIEKDANARRTFRLALTAAGRTAVGTLLSTPKPEPRPVHPDTMSHRFTDMTKLLGLRGASGKPYTPHSLRHFVATHLYNRTKDWVQVSKYMGHTSVSITMDLYANNVVEDTQIAIADVAPLLYAVR